MVGKLLSFCEGLLFSGAVLVSGRVHVIRLVLASLLDLLCVCFLKIG